LSCKLRIWNHGALLERGEGGGYINLQEKVCLLLFIIYSRALHPGKFRGRPPPCKIGGTYPIVYECCTTFTNGDTRTKSWHSYQNLTLIPKFLLIPNVYTRTKKSSLLRLLPLFPPYQLLVSTQAFHRNYLL